MSIYKGKQLIAGGGVADAFSPDTLKAGENVSFTEESGITEINVDIPEAGVAPEIRIYEAPFDDPNLITTDLDFSVFDTIMVFKNGVLLTETIEESGSGEESGFEYNDYTLSNPIIAFTSALKNTDRITVLGLGKVNGKSGGSGSGLTPEEAAHAAMPSEIYDIVTPQASGSTNRYLTPADGYIAVDTTGTDVSIAVYPASTGDNWIYQHGSHTNGGAAATVPCKEGQYYAVFYNGTVSIRFIYAEGSKHLKKN